METMPAKWYQRAVQACIQAGLSEPDAQDCAWAVLERYHRRRERFPWEEAGADERLFQRVVANIVAEFRRTQRFRQAREADYCALVRLQIEATPALQTQAIEHVEYERFLHSLPPYLRQTLRLLQQGYTVREVAQIRGVSKLTIYAYRQELRAKFVDFFGYDPRKSVGCVVNYSGNANRHSQSDTEEVSDDAPTAEVLEFDGAIVSDSELSGDAPHRGSAERTARGGGGTNVPAMSNSGGCGCSSNHALMSAPETSRLLHEVSATLIAPGCGATCCAKHPKSVTFCQDCCDDCCTGQGRRCREACYAACLNCAEPRNEPASNLQWR